MAVSDFLSGLGGILSQQFNLGENKNKSLDFVQDGQINRYGKLAGDFANSFDQTADRSYTEEGSFKNDLYNPQPKILNILNQTPTATVFVKKRAFSSLAENFRPDLMDDKERLFYKSMKVLFQNKCKQISNYEKLSKIAEISANIGQVNSALLPIIFNITDNLTDLPGSFDNSSGLASSLNTSLGSFKNIVDRVREVVAMSQDNQYTTWLTNIPDSFRSTFGEGTGVIELTLITSLSTTTSINFGQGQFSFNLTDPYELMLITNNDIDQAIYDANNIVYNNSFVQLGIQSLNEVIDSRRKELNANRLARGAGPINFIIDPNTYLGKRVRAIIDNIGFEIQFDGSVLGAEPDQSAKEGSDQAGQQGLTPSEVDQFSGIIASIFTQLSLAENSRRDARQSNTELTYVRNKMRLHFSGDLIVQPMDQVHIYIDSKTKQDNKITAGFQNNFTGLNFLQGTQSVIENIANSLNSSNGFSIEKSIFVGNDFPNWLWQSMRSQFVSDDKGAHVFAGIVSEATSSYSNSGFFNVSVNGTDNAGYFDYGIVNFKPSIDVFNGSLYDPLTPFDIKFDSVTGVQKDSTPDLLPENKGIFQSAFVKDKNGLLAGISPTEKNFLNQDAERSQNTSVKRVFYDPDGFVYRWKEGIGTLVLFGDSYTENPISKTTPALTNDPFAGQDVINVLSLLISGQPYNYATFYKAATQFDSFARDPSTGEDPALSYFRGLQNSLKYRNLVYGNFVPFKKLSIDEATYSKMLGNQLNAQAFDAQLQELIEKRATVADRLVFLTGNKQGNLGVNAVPEKDVNAVSQLISQYDLQIQNKIQAIQDELNKINAPILIYGNDISFDYEPSLGVGDTTRLNPASRKELRRKINFLTRRLIWKVRANEDISLVIIDDAYDKDSDIQAFEKSFTNMSLFKSDYITVAEKIKTVSGILELEVFANTQGHIEIRNPQYNRVPSSVFYRMLRMKTEMGIQVFPQFIEDLYTNQLQTLFTQISVIEDEMRLYCLALGYITDTDCDVFISNPSDALSNGINQANGGFFKFLSDEGTGNVDTQDLRTITQTANPEAIINATDNALKTVKDQKNLGSTFDAGRRASILQSNVNPAADANNTSQFKNLTQILSSPAAVNRKKMLIDRLNQNSGQQFNFDQLFGSTNGGLRQINAISSTDILQILNGIAQRISDRQKAVKLTANALKNINEAAHTNAKDNSTTNGLLFPSLNTATTSIPQIFEHLIEDESYDDLGPGSGARYVLHNKNIISYSITKKKPRYTAVEVTGRYGGDQLIQNNDLPTDLDVFQNGNALVTAAAVDYDLWRMYGISLPQDIQAPFLTNPNTQCAPYAVSLLNRAKKEVISGTITIVGNEYQQPGEVVYFENRDQLFYVESVSHDFTYGSGFKTSINVGFGHNPGEYIPTPYDVIGKLLYKNKDITNYVHNRQGTSFNQQHMGTLVGNVSQDILTSGDTDDDLINGSYAKDNRVALQKIIENATSILSTVSDNYNPVLEIRIFYNTDGNFSDFNGQSNYANDLANSVKNYLIGKSNLSGNTNPIGNTDTNVQSLQAFEKQIIVKAVDSSALSKGDYRYPSAKAFFYARNALGKSAAQSASGATELQHNIDTMIYNYIVDCWVVFNNG